MPNDFVQRLDAAWPDNIQPLLIAALSRQQVSRQDLYDVVNETYHRMRNRNDTTDIDDLEGYAIRVAMNILSQGREQGSRFVDLDDAKLIDQQLVSDIDTHHPLEQAYDLDREIQAVLQHLDQLSEREKFSIIARRLDETSANEIAAKFGCSPRTVQRDIEKGFGLISRAIKRLRGERDEE